MTTNKEIKITELEDFSGSLFELKTIIDSLIQKYNKNSIITFDASYYNISVNLKLKE